MLNDVDRPLVDLVVVIGTSLKVRPVSMIPEFIRPEVPQIYISREPIHDISFDLQLLGDCDTILAEVCRAAGTGWELEHDMLHPKTVKARIAQVKNIPGASVVRFPTVESKETVDSSSKMDPEHAKD
jgi:NAD+-dependent protein deacetylase SIR2